LETAGYSETGLWDRLEAFQAVSAEIAGAQDIAEVADRALQLALELTGAGVAFIASLDDAGNRQQVYSRAADPSLSVTGDEIDRLFAAASIGTWPAASSWLVASTAGCSAATTLCGHTR